MKNLPLLTHIKIPLGVSEAPFQKFKLNVLMKFFPNSFKIYYDVLPLKDEKFRTSCFDNLLENIQSIKGSFAFKYTLRISEKISLAYFLVEYSNKIPNEQKSVIIKKKLQDLISITLLKEMYDMLDFEIKNSLEKVVRDILEYRQVSSGEIVSILFSTPRTILQYRSQSDFVKISIDVFTNHSTQILNNFDNEYKEAMEKNVPEARKEFIDKWERLFPHFQQSIESIARMMSLKNFPSDSIEKMNLIYSRIKNARKEIFALYAKGEQLSRV